MPPLRRFDLAPPRRFLFPAVLLLLAEEPSYGYRLVKEVEGFRLGATDRPSVYRNLAQLERDRLVTSWSDEVKSAQSRRLYRLTPEGERVLRVWMGVIKEERDGLDAVLRRYAATGGADAALAGAEGGWGAVQTRAVSPVAATTQPSPRRLAAVRRPEALDRPAGPRRQPPRPVRPRPRSLRRARRGALVGWPADVRRDRPDRLDRDASCAAAACCPTS